MDKVEKNLSARIDRLEFKFDRLQWFLLAGLIAIFMKDYILNFLN